MCLFLEEAGDIQFIDPSGAFQQNIHWAGRGEYFYKCTTRVNKWNIPRHLSWTTILSCDKKWNHESYLDLVHFFFVDIWEGQLTKRRPLIGLEVSNLIAMCTLANERPGFFPFFSNLNKPNEQGCGH